MIPYQEKLLPMLEYTSYVLKNLGEIYFPTKQIFFNKPKKVLIIQPSLNLFRVMCRFSSDFNETHINNRFT